MTSVAPPALITGEWRRKLDDRFRLAIPLEVASQIVDAQGDALLVKERSGCLSLWRSADMRRRLEDGLGVIRQKIEAGRLQERWPEVQRMGRLVSTRQQAVRLANRARLVIPEGFRELLGVAPDGDVIIVGAAICVELWHPERWLDWLRAEMPEFHGLFHNLSQ